MKTVGPALRARGAATRSCSATTTTGRCTPTTTTRPTRQPGLREVAARRPRRQPLARRHRVPLLLGRPRVAVGAARRVSRTRTSTSPSAPARSPATRRPRSRDTLHWHTRYLTVGAVRNWAKTVITWNAALDPEGGPHNGGCDTCTGVVTIDPATGARPRARPTTTCSGTSRSSSGPARGGSPRASTARSGRRLPQPGRLDRRGGGQRRLGRRLAALQPAPRRPRAVLRPARGGGRHVHVCDEAVQAAVAIVARRMDAFQAIVLGIVQGLTEFLPVSSTGHLRIVPAFLGWEDPGAAFTAVTQLGTMAAVLLYFREDLWRIATHLAAQPARPGAARDAGRADGLVHRPRHDPDRDRRPRSSTTRSRRARARCT